MTQVEQKINKIPNTIEEVKHGFEGKSRETLEYIDRLGEQLASLNKRFHVVESVTEDIQAK